MRDCPRRAAALALAGVIAGACSPGGPPGDAAVYERIDGLTDCFLVAQRVERFRAEAERHPDDDARAELAREYEDYARGRAGQLGC